MFLLSHFSTFLSAMTCISLTLCKKTLKPSKKYFNSQDKSFEKKLHIREFQLKGIGGNMIEVASKKVYWKNNRVFQISKHLRHIAIEKDIFF